MVALNIQIKLLFKNSKKKHFTLFETTKITHTFQINCKCYYFVFAFLCVLCCVFCFCSLCVNSYFAVLLLFSLAASVI